MNQGNCPECDEPLDYDEVDIGVGVQIGNIRCEHCGWSPPDPLREWEERAQRESDAQLAAYDAHPDQEDE